jgi:pimeloyl-ACP methyl ester carboxylesterase
VRTAHNGDVNIAYETFGSAKGIPLLLISGTGVQMLIWPDELCLSLVDRGFCVARFDNRDMGLSTHLTGVAAPGWLKVMVRPSLAPYRLDDMADDALAVIDALRWTSAHVVGTSLGGMVAQSLAINHPTRVRTLTSMMSTPSSRIATMPKLAVMRALGEAGGIRVTNAEQAADVAVRLKRAMASSSYPIDEELVRDIAMRSYERDPGSEEDDIRQRAAVIASGSRRKLLHSLRIPTLVIHGDEDPVIRPKGGRATAQAIPGAKFVSYDGMGHDLPRALWPAMLDEISALASRAEPAGAVTLASASA